MHVEEALLVLEICVLPLILLGRCPLPLGLLVLAQLQLQVRVNLGRARLIFGTEISSLNALDIQTSSLD